jgi:hypothetical protein
MVKAETKEIEVEQLEADTTALTSPQNTENDVDVEIAKRTQVEKTAKTILATNTEALKSETPNRFKNKNRQDRRKPSTSSRSLTWRLWRKTSV